MREEVITTTIQEEIATPPESYLEQGEKLLSQAEEAVEALRKGNSALWMS